MAVKALKSHSQSKVHQKLINEKEQILNFFKKKANKGEQVDWLEPEVMEVLFANQGSSVMQATTPPSFQDKGKLNARI